MATNGSAADTSPVRAVARMFRCPVCDATGKIGTTLGFGGTVCNLCQGSCFLNREPTPCPACDAKGGNPKFFGLSWMTCLLCHGVRYLMEKPVRCPKCRATGLIKSMGGMFSRPCDLCNRQRYLRAPHGTCIKCNHTAPFMKLIRSCINCGGIGFSREPQHLCPRCQSTGKFKGNTCMLCTGTGVIHHEVAACVKCGGAGDIPRTLSLLRGKLCCPTCNGQGYFQVVPSTLAPVRQARAKGKRERPDQENGSGDGWGHRVPEEDDGENADREGGEAWDENGGGGSEPRRRVRRRTPGKDSTSRRQTFDGSDMPPPMGAAMGRASTGGRGGDLAHNRSDFGMTPQPRLFSAGSGGSSNREPFEFSPPANARGAVDSGAGSSGVFSPGVGGNLEPQSARAMTRRR